MLKKWDKWRYLAPATVATLVLVMFYDKINLPSMTLLSHQTPEPRRQGLLIIGRGRSGTSFVSKMFAHGLRVSLILKPQMKKQTAGFNFVR